MYTVKYIVAIVMYTSIIEFAKDGPWKPLLIPNSYNAAGRIQLRFLLNLGDYNKDLIKENSDQIINDTRNLKHVGDKGKIWVFIAYIDKYFKTSKLLLCLLNELYQNLEYKIIH